MQDDTTCLQCGKPFVDAKHPNRKYCSRACFNVAQSGSGIIPCDVCGTPFRREYAAQKYCSKACYGASRRVRPIVERAEACLTCGSPLPWYSVKYCSKACHAKSQRHASDTRIKICEQCGKSYEINAYHHNTRYCSRSCAYVAGTYLPVLTKTCRVCATEFTTKKVHRKYCSPDCKIEGQRLRWESLSPEQRALEVERLQGITEFTSNIELRLHEILDLWRIEYLAQYRIHHYFADIYIPRLNLVIEAYGCYWHSCPTCGLKGPVKADDDAKRADDITKWGHRIAVIWEHDIRRDAETSLLAVFQAMGQQTT